MPGLASEVDNFSCEPHGDSRMSSGNFRIGDVRRFELLLLESERPFGRNAISPPSPPELGRRSPGSHPVWPRSSSPTRRSRACVALARPSTCRAPWDARSPDCVSDDAQPIWCCAFLSLNPWIGDFERSSAGLDEPRLVGDVLAHG